MADEPESLADRIKARQAALAHEKGRKDKASAAVNEAFDALVQQFAGYATQYADDPTFSQAVDEEGKGALQVLFRLAISAVEDQDAFKTPEARLAIQALTKKDGIPESARAAGGDGELIHTYANDAANTAHNRAALTARIKEIATDKGVIKTVGKPTKPGPAKTGSTPDADADAALGPVAASPGWTDDSAPGNTAAPGFPPIDLGVGASGFPNFGGAGGIPDGRSAADIEAAAKKLRNDARKIVAVCDEALKRDVAAEYTHLAKAKPYLEQLRITANEALKTITMTAGLASPKTAASAPIAVNDTNIKSWTSAVDSETERLRESLVKFEGAQFALKKAKSGKLMLTRKLADGMIAAFNECDVPTRAAPGVETNLDPLDTALTPPSLMQRHGGKLLAAGGVLATIAAVSVGAPLLMRDDARPKKDEPDNGALVARNDGPPPKAIEPPKEKPKAAVIKEAPKKEEPKKEAPKLAAPGDIAPPPKPDEPKAAPVAIVRPEDNPVGKKEKDLRILFEKNVIDDFVLANPEVLTRGFVATDKEGVYKVAENVKLSYMPLSDVNRGIYVMHNSSSGKTLIAPPASKRVELAIVQNPPPKRGGASNSFHLSQMNGGKETVLKDQLGEVLNFTLPDTVQPNKFMTGEISSDRKSPMIEIAAYYIGGKDERKDKQRVDGVECPIIHPGLKISGRPIVVHSGVTLNLQGVLADYVPYVRSKYEGIRGGTSGGAGDPSDSYVLLAANKQEPLVITDRHFNTYDLAQGVIVAGAKGGFDTPVLKADGQVFPLRQRASLPAGDRRNPLGRDITTQGEGLSNLYILPGKDVSYRMAMGTGNPESFTQGSPVINKQVDRIKDYIRETEGLLVPQDDKLFTFAEMAIQRIRAERDLSEIKWARLESPRAHSRIPPALEPGAFGPAAGPLIARPGLREKQTSERYTNNGLTLKDENESKTHTWLDEHKRAAQALLDRASDPKQMALTKKAAGEKFKRAEDIIKDMLKVPPADDDKAKKLNEIYDLEAEAARLLSVSYPDPLRMDADDKEKGDHEKRVKEARTLMRSLLQKTPAAILQNAVETQLRKELDPRTPVFKVTEEDVDFDARLIKRSDALLASREGESDPLADLESRRGMPIRRNPIQDFVDDKRGWQKYAEGKEETDHVARHRDKSTGKGKPWEIG